ncbi:MAG: C45 family autoproteolytic acyltransferase/hydrolase [Brooklawnia sp.]
MTMPPIVKVSAADPFERGAQIGEQCAERIQRSVDLYEAVFAHYAQLPWSQVVDYAKQFRAPIAEFSPDIMAEMDGIAAGANRSREEILALNARSEVMFGLKVEPAGECTSFFAGPSATSNGHTLVGQNWDWKPACTDTLVLLEIDQGESLPAFVTIVEAGLLAKTGFNSAGIGLATNTLITPMDKGTPGVTYHVLLRQILNSWTIEDALASIFGAQRSASANYLIGAQRGVGVSVETTPGGVEGIHLVRPVEDVIGHSNNYVCDVPFEDYGAATFPDSPERVRELSTVLQSSSGAITPESIMTALRSHDAGYPDAICRHPNEEQPAIERIATDASAIYDLTTLTAQVTTGRPCENDYVDYTPAFARR